MRFELHVSTKECTTVLSLNHHTFAPSSTAMVMISSSHLNALAEPAPYRILSTSLLPDRWSKLSEHKAEMNSMQDSYSPEQKADLLSSLQRYFHENFDSELNDLQTDLLLDYITREIAPFAYNRGVEDARAYFSARLEDLPGVCFEEGLTYWESKPGAARGVRRKP